MPSEYFYHSLVLLLIFPSTFSERRIKDGYEVESHKKYVVYLLKAASAPVAYHGWTCGGAIVHPSFVITSAACVEDVQHMYVISGYNKYVASDRIDSDDCTKQFKKKVVFTCVPKTYKFDYNKTELWSRVDIAVIKVESPFDFQDKAYEKICSYIPVPIDVNYEIRYQMPGTDAMVLGWGHAYEYRKEREEASFNQKTLHYAPTRILEKDTCVKHFNESDEMPAIIQKYMICTLEAGNLNDKGELILKSEPVLQGCITTKERLLGVAGKPCESEEDIEDVSEIPDQDYNQEYEEDVAGGHVVVLDKTRRLKQGKVSGTEHKNVPKKIHNFSSEDNRDRSVKYESRQHSEKTETMKPKASQRRHGNGKSRKSKAEYKGKEDSGKNNGKRKEIENTRAKLVKQSHENEQTEAERRRQLLREEDDLKSPGICQNDHGGPLVTWVGTHEVLIGVASLFKIDNKMKCMGPYLFTSTQCNSAFLNCILSMENKAEAQRRCEDLRRQGFEMVQRRVSWIGHPDGPADNEKIQERPQVPMSAFHLG